MTGLLDDIFADLEKKDLDHCQVEAYIRHLDEILLQGLSPEKELAFQNIKLQLLRRMNQFKPEQIQFNRSGK